MLTERTDNPLREQEIIARALHAAELRIANLTRWTKPKPGSIEAAILPSLEAKRDRLTRELAALRQRIPPQPSRLDCNLTGDIKFKSRTWHTAGTLTIDCALGDIPACLKRSAP